MSGEIVRKTCTGLTGLAVARTPIHTLSTLYRKILKVCARMPDDAAYRKYTERTINERLQVVQNNPHPEKIEEKINSGQIEELIVQAENELNLARRVVKWKVWEPLQTHPPENQWRWPPNA